VIVVLPFLLFGTPPAFGQEVLKVSGIYGGVWADSIRNAILKPFESKFGVKLEIEEGISAVTLAKLRQQKGSPQLDVVWMDRVVSDNAILEGLTERIDPEKIPNLRDVVAEAVQKDKKGDIQAITTGFWAAGIAYNKKAVKSPPTSWLDLWRPEYKGKLAMYNPENAICLPILVTIAELRGGGPNNIDPAFKAVQELAKNGAVFFGGSPAGGNLLATGEVVIATLASSQVWDLQKQGHPIEYVAPKEGAVAGDMRVHIVKGTKRKDLAEKLVNFAVSDEAQRALATLLLVAPVNTKVVLPADVAAKMPWGSGGNVKKLRLVDPYLILEQRSAWVERWNKEIVK
jgi:putative spermidine/putrescine transport system substrate-binding protein